MNDKTPDQALYDAIFTTSNELGFHTYTHNPPNGYSYPFVHVADSQLLPRPTKSYQTATLWVTVDIWGSADDRKSVSSMAHRLIQQCSKIKQLENGLSARMDYQETTTMIIADNSTNEDLWRATISLSFKVY